MPECKFENAQRREFTVTEQDISVLAEKYKDTEFDQLIEGGCDSSGKNCKFTKISFDALDPLEQKKVARSILKEEFGDITFVDDLKDCPSGHRCQQFQKTEIPDNSLGDRISHCNFQIRYKNEKIIYSVYAEDTLPTPFALFGSCKTVTLDRDLGVSKILESKTEKDQNDMVDLVSSIEINFEPKLGEPTKFSGKVQFESGESKGKELKFQLFINTVFNPIGVNDFPKKTTLDRDGEFEFEYEFPFIGEDRIDHYALIIEYGEFIVEDIEFELIS